jgi:photosystem II stability/assembly factor-like uncharacterized protein
MKARSGRACAVVVAAALSGMAVVAAAVPDVVGHAAGSPVGEALARPALAARDPAQAVLLGAALAGARVVAVGERGIVVGSDDAGRHWQQAVVPVSVTLTAVRFVDAQHGLAVGHGGVVLGSDDGGRLWTRRLDGQALAQLALTAAQASGDAARIRDARRLVADGADKPLLDLALIDARHALVVGAYGLAFATDDGGQTWVPWMDRLDNPKGLHLYAVRQRGDTVLLAGEQGLVLMSQDGGMHFRRLALPYKGSFFTAELPGPGQLVLAGLRGHVWRSADAGVSWAPLSTPLPVSITGSALRQDGTLLLANQAGQVLALRDGVLVPMRSAPLPPLNGLLPLRGGELLALSMQGALPVSMAALP